MDKNYIALSVVSLRKAIKLMVNGKVEPVQDGKIIAQIKCLRGLFAVPSIVRLTIDIPWKAHISYSRFSRKNVIVRDNGKCQYCGNNLGKNLSIDHVIPISRGGKRITLIAWLVVINAIIIKLIVLQKKQI